MSSNQIIFAGVDISSGRKPVMFAALDGDLNILMLEKWNISETIKYLKEYQLALLAVNSSAKKLEVNSDFKEEIAQAGFNSFAHKSSAYQWIETEAQDCFRDLVGQTLLSRRTLEGRIQRALILYDEGLQIDDPMDLFEEITRHKLLQGILPLENIYSSRELDALVTAYLAWMAANRIGQIEMLKDNMVKPKVQADQ